MDFIPSFTNIATSTLADATAAFTYFRPVLMLGLAIVLGVGGIVIVLDRVTSAVHGVGGGH